jgi:hypothetical protein
VSDRVCLLGLVVLLAGCVGVPGIDPDNARLHDQANAALARWADAAAKAGNATDFSPVGDLTGQVGDWEAAVGDNNKSALMSGVITASPPLSMQQPPDGQIRWPDGSSESAALMTAADALTAIQKDGVQPCPTCTPLEVTDAKLVSGQIQTTKGLATVPEWAFTIGGTNVVVTRVALEQAVTVVPPPWDSSNPPVGLSVERAQIAADDKTLTAFFVGAPDDASKPCGEDYTAEGVESDLAVVIIIHVRRNPTPGACDAVGAERTATVELQKPLGSRAVLEVQQGLPVSVTHG